MTLPGTNNIDCVRCGRCCLSIPCYWAQMKYDISAVNNRQCPDLIDNGDLTYTCGQMVVNPILRRELLGTGCHYNEEAVRSHLASNQQVVIGDKGQ